MENVVSIKNLKFSVAAGFDSTSYFLKLTYDSGEEYAAHKLLIGAEELQDPEKFVDRVNAILQFVAADVDAGKVLTESSPGHWTLAAN